jgi:hypothetical protein
LVRFYGVLFYWSGCLAVVVFALALVSVPSGFAQTGGGGTYSGQCPNGPPPTYGCESPGHICDYAGQPGTCQIVGVNGAGGCTCGGAGK